MYRGHVNHFGHTRWYSYVMLVKCKLISIHLEIVLISAQDRCTDSVERTTGMEIILGHPMVLLGDVGHVEAHFGLFGDSVDLSTR